MLACSECEGDISIGSGVIIASDGEIAEGILVCNNCRSEFPIKNGIPQFVPSGHANPPPLKEINIQGQGYGDLKSFKKCFVKVYMLNLRINKRIISKLLSNNAGFIDYYQKLIFGNQVMNPDSVLLDLGCGSRYHINVGRYLDNIIGVDIDAAKLAVNEYKTKIAADVCCLPMRENTIDNIFSQDLFEHLQHPDIVIKRLKRILKTNGRIILKIPNKNSIFGFFTRLTPFRLHKLYSKMTLAHYPDTTPTFYKFNDRKTIETIAVENGLILENIEYFCSYPPAPFFLPFCIYFPYCVVLKLINSIRGIKHFSDVIVCSLAHQR